MNQAGFPDSSEGKASACNVGDLGSIPGSGRSPEEGDGNPLQYSCLENSIDGGLVGYSPSGPKESHTTEHFTSYESDCLSLLAVRSSDSMLDLIRVKNRLDHPHSQSTLH